jgi:hypothetical protein
MFNPLRKRSALNRLAEEKIYQQVLQEVGAGIIRDGLWAKPLAKCNGNDEKAKSLYISYRAQSLVDQDLLDNEHIKSQELLIKDQRRLEKEILDQILDDNAKKHNYRKTTGHTNIPMPKAGNSGLIPALIILISGFILLLMLLD